MSRAAIEKVRYFFGLPVYYAQLDATCVAEFEPHLSLTPPVFSLIP
jgi:hypothetical protein